MKHLRQKMLRRQHPFNSRMKRAITVGSAGAFMLFFLVFATVQHRLLFPEPGEPPRINIPDDDFRLTIEPEKEPDSTSPSAELELGNPDDPSQLVKSDLIAPHAVGQIIVRDGVKSTRIDEDVLRDILQAVMAVSQEELLSRVDHSIVWDDFNNENRRNRIMGRVCRFKGTLRRWTANDNLAFPELGIDRLYEGQIQDSRNRWYSFYVVEEPDQPWETNDAAELTGVFYMLITYQTRAGDDMVTPLIVARRLEIAQQQSARGILGIVPPWLLYGAILFTSAFLCLGFHLLLKSKSPGRRRT